MVWSIVIHGGAGVISPELPEERVKPYRDALDECIKIGAEILRSKGTATDAVEACIRYMEDCELFNAGKGSVLNRNGEFEMDASIMVGNTLRCGAVSAIKNVKNPITVARAVMEKTKHILLTSEGAYEFAREAKMETAPQFYFFTERRHQQWVEAQKADRVQLDHAREDAKGTVGCVALDEFGTLVAGTSTGGMTNKMPGRVGDSPLIGSGNYANKICAISATGTGEQMIRHCVGHDIAALMEYKGLSLKDAASEVVFKKLDPDDGGIIGVDKDGNIAMIFNSIGMFRACEDSKGNRDVKIWE